MGNILSYFVRKKTSLEELQNIDETIKSIEEYHFNVQRRRKLTENFLFYAMVLLIVFGCCYLYFFPRGITDGKFIWAILIALSILLLFLRRIVSWYFEWKIKNNRRKRNDAMAAKEKIIKNVMETETYNVANTILEKYAPHLRPRLQTQNLPVSAVRPMQLMQPGSDIRRRQSPPSQSGAPRPIHQRQSSGYEGKSIFNRIVEQLLGDGPSNRYALICTNCHEHNGLVLPEEFPYTSFRCPKCSQFHPARKPRPFSPRLPEFVPAVPVLENLNISEKVEEIVENNEEVENSPAESVNPEIPADSQSTSEPDQDKE